MATHFGIGLAVHEIRATKHERVHVCRLCMRELVEYRRVQDGGALWRRDLTTNVLSGFQPAAPCGTGDVAFKDSVVEYVVCDADERQRERRRVVVHYARPRVFAVQVLG